MQRAEGLRARDVVIAIFVVAFTAVQVAVPVAMLAARGGIGGAPPRTGELPFSWQMYTIVRGPFPVLIETVDGIIETDADTVFGPGRARLAYDLSVLREACRSVDGSSAVTLHLADSVRQVSC